MQLLKVYVSKSGQSHHFQTLTSPYVENVSQIFDHCPILFTARTEERDLSTQRPSITTTIRFIFPDTLTSFSLFATLFSHSPFTTNLPAPTELRFYFVITNYRNRDTTIQLSPTTSCDSCYYCLCQERLHDLCCCPSTSFRTADNRNLRD
jgi:hypothetical protein